ncbi:hypothetical protein [Asaia bogorensis]|uniref:hypothetical protein n=1 Tax=Asaia bogorensis TaxID=91915 RepID=UPI000EFC3E7D|nr:hypothetical protein [Asaia bogorensis]
MAQSPEKATTERRIHVLPVELLERVRAYQSDNGIASEVEAVRRLLSEALQARDSVEDIMKQVRAQFQRDRDLRALARDVLSGHILVKQIEIGDSTLTFQTRSNEVGQISRDGTMAIGTSDEEGRFYDLTQWPLKPKRNVSKPSDDLDAEIPF